MFKLFKLSFVLTLFFSITACNDSIPVPQIGQSRSSLEELWTSKKVGRIDKESFPNVWIVKKYHMMVEFDETDTIKHFAICCRDVYNSVITSAYDVFAKKSNVRVVYRHNSQYRYQCGLMPAWFFGISEEEANTLAKAFEADSKEFNKPESIIKDKEIIKKIRIHWWDYVLDIISQI